MCEILAHARHVKLFPPACSDASQEGLGCVWAGGAWEEMFVTETPLSRLPFLLPTTPQFPVQITLFISSHLKPSGDTKCSQSIQSQFRLLSWLLLTVLVFSCNSVYCVCVCVCIYHFTIPPTVPDVSCTALLVDFLHFLFLFTLNLMFSLPRMLFLFIFKVLVSDPPVPSHLITSL